MAQFDDGVTPVEASDLSLLPGGFSEFAIIATYLRKTGMLAAIEQCLLLPRKGGYQGVDVFVFFLAFFASSSIKGKIHKFSDRMTGKKNAQVAALAGRKVLPTQSAISRALASVTPSLVQELAKLLLRAPAGLKELLQEPAVKLWDCLGQSWHVFDMDPTATGVRLRALPEGELLPDPVRRNAEIAQPGYLGRKRGQAKLTRATVMHRGARMYVDAHVEPGNGGWSGVVQSGLAAIQDLATRCELPIQRCIAVTDGEGGGSVQTRLGLASQARFLTRLTEYAPLDQPEVIEALQQGRWERVADGLSGPQRWACEFGHKTFVDTGEARLVISRFENRTGSKRGAGKLVGQYQYEVYATDLPADAFPAPEIVTLYYGRAGIERYFAIEDRDFELDHIYSATTAGQAVVSLIALFLHNLQILLSVQARGGLPAVSIKQKPRHVEATPGDVWVVSQNEPVPSAAAETAVPSLDSDSPEVLEAIRTAVAKRPDVEMDDQHVRCMAGNLLRLNRRQEDEDGNLHLRFRGSPTPCNTCPLRPSCTTSTSESYAKELRVRIQRVDGVLRVADHWNPPRVDEVLRVADHWTPPHAVLPAGPKAMLPPLLRPQELRQSFEKLAESVHVRVTVNTERAEKPALHPLYVDDYARRQHRRRTWPERLAWNALPESRRVTIRIAAEDWLLRILPNPGSPAPQEAHR